MKMRKIMELEIAMFETYLSIVPSPRTAGLLRDGDICVAAIFMSAVVNKQILSFWSIGSFRNSLFLVLQSHNFLPTKQSTCTPKSPPKWLSPVYDATRSKDTWGAVPTKITNSPGWSEFLLDSPVAQSFYLFVGLPFIRSFRDLV